MPSTYTANLLFEKQATGENENSWGDKLNTVLDNIDIAISEQLSKSVVGGVTLTDAEALNAYHEYTGTLSGNVNVVVPSRNSTYIVYNNTSGAYTLTVKTSGGSGIAVTQGEKAVLYCDGTDVIKIIATDDFQAQDDGLDDIAGLAVTDGNFIVGDGSNWVAESGATARASLNLGSAALLTAPTVTDHSVARYDGTDGTVQDSGVTITDDDNLHGHGAEVNPQTGTTYTLTASDNGKVVTLNNASAITVTLPETSTEALAAGFQCVLIQRGAGQVTVAKEGSDTIESKDSNLSLTGQHSVATVVKLSAGSPNTYGLYGDLA